MANKKEEITDLFDPEAFDDPEYFVVGRAFKFATATIKITKIDRKNKRVWGEHITLVSGRTVNSHDGHDVGGGGPGDLPFCNDCKVSIDEPSTEDGDKKALDRKDAEDESNLQTA